MDRRRLRRVALRRTGEIDDELGKRQKPIVADVGFAVQGVEKGVGEDAVPQVRQLQCLLGLGGGCERRHIVVVGLVCKSSIVGPLRVAVVDKEQPATARAEYCALDLCPGDDRA